LKANSNVRTGTHVFGNVHGEVSRIFFGLTVLNATFAGVQSQELRFRE
jgi:hypothetical protein